MAPTVGVNIAIIQNGSILLTKREDFEIWCLPGGEVDAGESLAEAAMREAKEETGLDVRLLQLVGIYSLPDWQEGNHNVCFAAAAVGGELRLADGETIDVAYFPVDDLPDDLVPWHRQRIHDAVAGYGGSQVSLQHIQSPYPTFMSRDEIYSRRDNSDWSRRDFFMQMMNRVPPVETHAEVPGRRLPGS